MDLKSLYQCKFCVYTTIFDFALKHHEIRHVIKLNDYYPCVRAAECYKCDKCSFETSLKTHKVKHMKAGHYTKKRSEINIAKDLHTYSCKMCGLKTYSRLVYTKHKHACASTLKNRKKFVCVHCESKFKLKSQLKKHVKSAHKFGDVTWLKCEKYVYDSEDSSKVAEKVSYFKCEFCPFMAQLESSIKLHRLHRHSTEKNISFFQCEKCDYKTIHPNTLNAHIKSTHEIKPRQVWHHCNKCTYKAKSRALVQQHKIHKHPAVTVENAKKFKCEQCLRSYQTNAKLNEHVKRVHSVQKPEENLTCEHCSFKTSDQSHLKFHVENKLCVPESTKWFRCEYCAFMANVELSLRLHAKKCSKRK